MGERNSSQAVVAVLQVAPKTKPWVKFRLKLAFLNLFVILLVNHHAVMILMKVLKILSCQGIRCIG